DPRERRGAALARLHPHLHGRPAALPRVGRRGSSAPPPAADRAAPAVGPHALTLAERYLALAFQVGRHEPTLLGSYYGPREVEAQPLLEPARLVEEARSLLADLDGGDL